MLLALLADISVLNGAFLVEHNVALYLKRCSGSVGSIDMDHCICNVPLITFGVSALKTQTIFLIPTGAVALPPWKRTRSN